jgi:hypothetical protein
MKVYIKSHILSTFDDNAVPFPMESFYDRMIITIITEDTNE